jgi:hypothetical protein
VAARQLGSISLTVTLVTVATAATLVITLLIGSVILPAQPTAANGPPSVDSLTGSRAIITASGDVERVQTLDQLAVEEYNEDTTPGDPINLHLTFRGGGNSLLIRGESLTLNTPAPASRVIVSLQADTFYADPGDCTIELASIDYVVLEPSAVRAGPPRGRPIPSYTGTVDCPALQEFQSDIMISIQAVFQYRPEESPLS